MKSSVLQSSPANTYQSVEQSIIDGYLSDINDLKQLWLGSERVDERKLAIHISFIISKIPFKETRKLIKNNCDELEKKYLADPKTKGDAKILASFEAVTGVMEFIFDKFELVHEDIIGPGTSREFEKAIIEIPDMPEERINDLKKEPATGQA